MKPAPAVAAAIVLTVAACADDSPGAEVARSARGVVTIESQRCRQPNRFHGVGATIDDELVVTAGHLVEGDLRSLTVDGAPATVVVIDRNADLALVRVDGLDAAPVPVGAVGDDTLTMLGPVTRTRVDVRNREELVIEHATDRATYRRDVIVFTPGVVTGMSGSPLVDRQGRLAGIVILDDADTGEGLAVTAAHVVALRTSFERSRSAALLWPEPPGAC